MPSVLDAALGQQRAWSIAALSLLTILAWLWLIGGAGMQMDSFLSLLPPPRHQVAMPGMMMANPEPWTVWRFALTFSMWWTMMVAMMLPSAAPMILLYGRAAAHGNANIRPSSTSFLVGYLAAWSAFSLFATMLQASLERVGAIGVMQTSQNRWLSAAILMVAGLYQIGPIKDACLRQCRNPAQFLSSHYRPGRVGAVQMGMLHGTYCIGCCWLLMALLFVGGVMNLAWIALLTLAVAAEKLLPHGRLIARAIGVACIGGSLAIVLG